MVGTFDSSQALRYSFDFISGYQSVLGLAPYKVYLTKIVNDHIAFNDPDGTAVRTDTRILVADGYRKYAGTSDGYLNPPIKQLDASQLIISGGALTNNELILGPLVLPYTQFGVSLGTDPQIFQTFSNANNNTQLWIWIQGPGLNAANGNYFAIKEVLLDPMVNISYTVKLEATSNVPDLPPTNTF